MHDPNCIFCKIAKGDIPSHKIYEDEDVFAFLDIEPVNIGHALIIPKKHYVSMEETPDELLSKVFIVSKNLRPKIKQALDANVVALTVIGLHVPHFHVQLIPRFKDDGLGGFWPTKKYKDSTEAETTANKIRSAISS